VSDRIIHHTFHPEEYWAFFTIDTSLLTAVMLITGTFVAWFRENKGAHWFEIGRVSAVAAYVVVAVVYNALLRNDPPDARDVAASYPRPTPPNEVLHVWAPLIAVLEVILVNPVIRIKLVEAFWTACIRLFGWLPRLSEEHQPLVALLVHQPR
jgi:drug/metabolite transporter (DMT)-like permease